MAKPRIFTKTDGKTTYTREVSTPQQEVAATFEGYTEQVEQPDAKAADAAKPTEPKAADKSGGGASASGARSPAS